MGRSPRRGRAPDGRFELAVDVPPNTTATVRLPKAQLASVTEGGSPLGDGNGIGGRRQDGDDTVVEVGSGRYRFSYRGGAMKAWIGRLVTPRRPRARGARQPPALRIIQGGRRSAGGRLRESSERGPAPRLVALDERQHHQGRDQARPRVDAPRRHRRLPELRRLALRRQGRRQAPRLHDAGVEGGLLVRRRRSPTSSASRRRSPARRAGASPAGHG